MSLVWLIYFASIVEGIGHLFMFLPFVGGGLCLIFAGLLTHCLAEREPEVTIRKITSLLKKNLQ